MRGKWNSMVINCDNCKNNIDFEIEDVIEKQGKVLCPICNKYLPRYFEK